MSAEGINLSTPVQIDHLYQFYTAPSLTNPLAVIPFLGPFQVPGNVKRRLQDIDQGTNPPGCRSAKPYENLDGQLPRTDPTGKPIRYTENDVKPADMKQPPGRRFGTERIITGSDGSAYYSPQHYTGVGFQQIR